MNNNPLSPIASPCAIVRAWLPREELTLVELDAAERYREAGYHPNPWPEDTPEDFAEYEKRGLLWVAVVRGRAAGFAVVDEYDDIDHLEELDVARAHQGKGVGAALIAAVLHNARLRAKSAVTLRTFLTTPWSVGLYEKMGFRRWDPDPIPVWIAAIIDYERAIDLKPAERLSMRHTLSR